MKRKFDLEPLQDTTEGGTGGATGKTGDEKPGDTLATGGAGDGKKPEGQDSKTGDEGKGGKTGEEGKTGDEGKTGKGDGTETGGKAGDKPKAPEKYALTIPDGGRLDEADLKYVEDAARAADMTNEQAQAWITEQDSAIKAQSDRFLAETKADKDLGGDKLEATTKLARAGIDRLFPKGDAHREGFLKFLNRGGAGNNIHVVRALARIGKLTAEDTATGGQSGGGGGNTDPASKLYDKTPAS